MDILYFVLVVGALIGGYELYSHLKAIDIYVKNKDKARKEIIALFISKAKLTKAGSATYYALIKKRLG